MRCSVSSLSAGFTIIGLIAPVKDMQTLSVSITFTTSSKYFELKAIFSGSPLNCSTVKCSVTFPNSEDEEEISIVCSSMEARRTIFVLLLWIAGGAIQRISKLLRVNKKLRLEHCWNDLGCVRIRTLQNSGIEQQIFHPEQNLVVLHHDINHNVIVRQNFEQLDKRLAGDNRWLASSPYRQLRIGTSLLARR